MASIWVKEVDTALQALIATTVKAVGSTGALIAVPALVELPEGDFVTAQYPCVTIQHLSSEFRKDKAYWEKIATTVDETTGMITMASPAMPYELTYQIDFWALYREDIASMLRTWLSVIYPFSSLAVLDTDGVAGTVQMCIEGSINSLDEGQSDERVFRRSVIYRIDAFLDEEATEEAPYFKQLELVDVPMP